MKSTVKMQMADMESEDEDVCIEQIESPSYYICQYFSGNILTKISGIIFERFSKIRVQRIGCKDHMTEGGKKDAAYIASNVISVVKHFCAEDVVQVFMDGANKAKWPIVIKEFPWIICSWCVSHVTDLWFEDISKMTALHQLRPKLPN